MEGKTSWIAIIPDCCKMVIVIGFFTIWKTIINILTTKLQITDTTVSGKIGLIRIQTLDSPISKITSVKVEQGMFGRIFNYGDIYINSPAGNFQFECMSKPNELKQYLLDKMK